MASSVPEPPPTPSKLTWWRRGLVGTAVVAALLVGLVWANAPRATGSLQVPPPNALLVVGTTPTDTAKITAAAMADASRRTASATIDAAEVASVAAERTGRRTFLAAVVAGVLAFWSLWVAWRTHQQTERRNATERANADRLHVSQLFDNAAGRLGDDDDAVRTAAIFTLERVYQDAALLGSDDEGVGAAVDSLRRSVIETLCGYVRDRASQKKVPRVMSDYRSPASVRAAISILGRLDHTPEHTTYDLEGARLAGVEFRGTYPGLTLQNAAFGNNVSFDGAVFPGDSSWSGAAFHDVVSFAEARFEGRVMMRATTFVAVNLARAEFLGPAVFTGVKATDQAIFSGCTFHHNTYFGKGEFAKVAHFGAARFDKSVEFNETKFVGSARFLEVTFSGPAVFTSEFEGNTSFRDSEFQDVATFLLDAFRDPNRVFVGCTFDNPGDDPRTQRQTPDH